MYRSCSDAGEKKETRDLQAPDPSELGSRAEARGASLKPIVTSPWREGKAQFGEQALGRARGHGRDDADHGKRVFGLWLMVATPSLQLAL